MEQEKQETGFAQSLRNQWQNLKDTNLRAQAHYVVFRTAQNLKHKNAILTYYQDRFRSDWPKWLSIGAGLTGILMLLNPEGIWQWQWLWILIGLLLAPIVADAWSVLKTLLTEYPGKHLIGQEITLEQGITDGKGTVRVDNQHWETSGADCPPGSKARIIAINDRTLYVTPSSSMA